jgi:bacillopeptidase F (M6 metalloprotease family)
MTQSHGGRKTRSESAREGGRGTSQGPGKDEDANRKEKKARQSLEEAARHQPTIRQAEFLVKARNEQVYKRLLEKMEAIDVLGAEL